MKDFLASLACLGAIVGMLLAAPAESAAQTKKVIKNPLEYNQYMAAFNSKNYGQKAELLEAFLVKYPESVVKFDALELLLEAYQKTGNQAKVEDTAKRIVELKHDNVRALAILAYLNRAKGTTESAHEARGYAEKGLAVLGSWTKPENMSAEEFAKLRTQMAFIFNGAVGFGALQNKEYAVADEYYRKALAIDGSSLQDVYQAGIAELSMTPQDLTGFWRIVRAQQLALGQNNTEGAKAIGDYGRSQYIRYHGNSDGWDEFVAKATAQSAPPAHEELAKLITPRPTPCEVAVKAVNDAVKNDNINELSFSDYEFVLQQRDCSPEGKEAAETVWKHIQEKQKNGDVRLRLVGVKVIAATADTLDAALTEENQNQNKADLHVVLEKPLTKVPEAGEMTDVTGVFTGYTPEPFMFTMEKAEVSSTKQPAGKSARPGAQSSPAAEKTGGHRPPA